MTSPIVRARLYEVAIPLAVPFGISGGVMRARRSLILELENAHGARGFGESAPFESPCYSSETVASARACLMDWLLPAVLDQEFPTSTALDERLNAAVVGNEMAKAGIETAWWDLEARRTGCSLADLVTRRVTQLGVPAAWRQRRSRIDCGVAIGIPEDRDLGRLTDDVAVAVDRGYRRIKLKVAPGWDLEPVMRAQAVLRDVPSGVPLTVDANGAYDLVRDRRTLQRLDGCGLLYIEQPLPRDALWDSRTLAQTLHTPICLDESLTSELVARQMLAMGGPTVWNLKIQRVGGLESACRIYARAAEGGIRLWAGTMPETGLGAQAMLALAGHGGFVYPSDLEPSERWYGPGADLVELQMDRDGTMTVPEGPPAVVLGDEATLLYDSEGGERGAGSGRAPSR